VNLKPHSLHILAVGTDEEVEGILLGIGYKPYECFCKNRLMAHPHVTIVNFIGIGIDLWGQRSVALSTHVSAGSNV
jgi:hypothetical protein